MNWKATDILRMKILRSVFTETSSWKAVFLWSLYLNHCKPEAEFQGRTQPEHHATLSSRRDSLEAGEQGLGCGDAGVGVGRGHCSELSASGFLGQNPRKIVGGTLSLAPHCGILGAAVSTLIQVGWPRLASKPDMFTLKQMPSTNFQARISELWFVPAITLTSSGQMDASCISL